MISAVASNPSSSPAGLAWLVSLQELTATISTFEGKIAMTCVILAVVLMIALGSGRAPSEIKTPYLVPKTPLAPKDQLLLDMLDPKRNNFVITDPALNDNPIIYASDSFCKFTGYDKNEIQGRNCRFLQGEKSDPGDVKKIRDAVYDRTETNVQLLNYKKNGETFINQFFITPLRDATVHAKPVYYVGIQHEIKRPGPGQHHENVGWVYTFGSQS